MPQPNAPDILHANIADAIDVFEGLREHGPALQRAAELLIECLLNGRKLLVCGNGGSSADASHIAAEIVGRFVLERKGYTAIALSDSPGIITAVSNDYGFDEVFARQVEAMGRPGDVLLAITTSGNSPNVRRALEAANKLGLKSIAMLGRDGGAARGMATVELIVRTTVTARIQEAHQMLYHSLCAAIDPALKGQ